MTPTPESGRDPVASGPDSQDQSAAGDSAVWRRVAGFETAAELRSSYEAAVEEGVDPDQLEVLSNVPIEGLAGPKSRVLLCALGGALIGGLSIFLLATESAKAYPLVTGGMPIVAGPAVGLVTFEGTAIGAILATVLGVLWEGRIFRRTRADAITERAQDLLAQGFHVLAVAPGSGELELPGSSLKGAVTPAEASSEPDPVSG